MPIVPESSLIALEPIEPVAWSDAYGSIQPEWLADPVAGPALRHYLLLTHQSNAADRLGLTPSELTWNRVYWMGRFSQLWKEQHKQQAMPDRLVDRLIIDLLDQTRSGTWWAESDEPRILDRLAVDGARIQGEGPVPDGPWFASLDHAREVDGIRQCLGPLAGRNRIAAEFYDGPGWRRFRPVERLFLAVQGGTQRARRQILRHLDGLPEGARVLEVGIGDGANLRFLPRSWTTYGVDIAQGPLRAALVNNPGLRGRLALAEAEALPFAAATFDACVSVGGFNYYGDHTQALGEMARVVRPGGRLVVADELPTLHRWGIGHLLGVPKVDAAWLRALGLDVEFVAMVHGLSDDPRLTIESVWPGATRNAIWAGVGYCYSATRPD